MLDATAGRRQRQLPDGSVMVQCVNPGHDDRNPSLHVTWEATEHGGRTLLYCHACGPAVTQDDWAGYLNLDLDDLFDDRRWSWHQRPGKPETRQRSVRTRKHAARQGRPGPLPAKIAGCLHELLDQPAPAPPPPGCAHAHEHVEDYHYTDETGEVRHRVQREVCHCCGHKNFPQQWRANRRWGKKPPGTPVWLYRHPQVAATAAAGGQVWLLEGEKDVHAAEALGLVATTNPGGATNFPAELAPVFAGAHVTVVLDRDDAGWTRGVQVHHLLTQAGAATVRLALPLVTTPKADFSDHLQAGHDPRLVDEVPVDAVRAWAGLKEVRGHRDTIQTCEAEAQAQAQVARYDTRHGRKAKAGDRRRFAVRWAQEALRVHARMVDAATDVLKHVAAVPGDVWAEQAGEVAVSVTTGSAGLVTALYELVGQDPPVELETTRELLTQASATSTATPALDPVEEGLDGPGEQPGPGWTPRVVPGGADPGGGGGGGSRYRTGVRIIAPDYNVVLSEAGRLELVQIKNEQRGRGEDAHWEQSFSRVLNCRVEITRRERAETDDEIDDSLIDLDSLGDRDPSMRAEQTPALGKTSHVIIQVQADPGEDPQPFRIPFDDYLDGSFVGHLPVPGLTYQTTRAGRERIVTAINYVSTAAQIVTAYRATGWRNVDGQDMWVTANGAIGAEGWVPAPTNLRGPLARFNLPAPTTDAARLRAAFLDHSAAMMDRFPDRVAAVLLGTAYRSVLCPNEWVTVLTAPPGVGKTGLASLTMHHYGELWDRTRPLTSLSGNGATTNALRLMLHQVKDGLAFLDDNAPTAGIEAAYRRLEELIRMIHNAEDRPRSSRDGQDTLPGGRPRASGLVTTELPPRAGTSGERRGFMVPLSKGEIEIDRIKELDVLESRHGRALLGASFMQWIAQAGRRDVLTRLTGLREEFAEWVVGHPLHTPAQAQHLAKIAELYAGWALMIDCLSERGALSEQEANAWRARVGKALLGAADSAEDPDLVASTGQRVRDLLRYALANGLAYASDIRSGMAPAELQPQTGWSPMTRTTSSGFGEPVEVVTDWRKKERAIHLGYVNSAPARTGEVGPELVCARTSLEATLKAAAAEMADTSTLDLGTVLRALQDEGVLKFGVEEREDNIVVHRMLARTIHCEKSVADPSRATRDKRVVLRLEELLGGSDDGTDPAEPSGAGPGRGPAPGSTSGPAEPSGAGPGVDPDQPGEWPVLTDEDEPVDEPVVQDLKKDRPAGPEQKGQDMATHQNSGGLALPSVHSGIGPCVAGCGFDCGVLFAGVRLHLACFWATKAGTVEQLRSEFASSAGESNSQPEPPTAQDPTEVLPDAETSSDTLVRPEPARPTPTAGTRPRRVTDQGGFAATVVVVDVDGYYLPGQAKAELPFPIEHAGHLEQLGRHVRVGVAPFRWRKFPAAGLVVPTPALWSALGVPMDVPARAVKKHQWWQDTSAGLPFLTRAVDDGWVFGTGEGPPMLKGVTRLRREGAERGQAAILFTPALPASYNLGVDVDPGSVAARLELVATAVGLPFSGSPISFGLDLLKVLLPKDVRAALSPQNAVDYDHIGPAQMVECEPNFDFTRVPTSEEAQAQHLVLFDRGGSYLPTWSSLKIGVGAPERHEDELGFDPRRAGWWQVQLPKRAEGDGQPYPDLLDPQGNRAGLLVWVTTPALEYAVRYLDVEPVVVASWTWPAERSKAWLKPLYEVLRDALTQLRAITGPDSAAAQGLVKEIYKQLSGHFISTDSDTRANPHLAYDGAIDMHHPYAHHAIRAKARVAILHQILAIGHSQVGQWPLVVSNNDLIGYTANTLDPQQAWPGKPEKLGFGLGQYKLERWAELNGHLEYLTGKGWSGRDATSKREPS